MKWFCPFCWHELKGDEEVCPYCKRSLTDFISMDFDDKLVLGLSNPVTQNRMFVIEIIGRRRVKKAVPYLCKMLHEKRDTYELIKIAEALLNIGTEDAINCLKNLKVDDNTILMRFLKDSLKLNYQKIDL